eukprot:TRINITY_DN289_c0_g4_i2.p1 TRINITY_DN289_c0_g4~~TRINITY_DN289_c0_g4_i2.p1  ORF type:complete len:169 (+),score=44.38 TRINITY_DN289_c0_g4_i2:113-619(+)
MAAIQKQQRIGAQWFAKWFYGMDGFPVRDHALELIKAVFIVAGGDGSISETERNFFLGYLDAVGLPDDLHEFFKTYPGNERLEDILANSQSIKDDSAKRSILYTAILVAGSDGYAQGEHDQVVKFGAILGLSAEDVAQVEALAEAEKKQGEERRRILFRGNNPWANTQ